MASRSYSPREVERGIQKLTNLYSTDHQNGFARRTTKEKFGWYYVDSVREFRISSKLPAKGTVGKGRIKSLRDYLHLSADEFAALCDCPMSGPDYHAKIRQLKQQGSLSQSPR